MSRRSILTPEAKRDVAEAFRWYESRQAGLGDEFLRCLDVRLAVIQRNPKIHAIVYDTYRRALLRRFPYAIYYEETPDAVYVYGVFHCSQDPRKWRERLP